MKINLLNLTKQLIVSILLLFYFDNNCLRAFKIEITKGDVQPDPIAIVDFVSGAALEDLGQKIASVLQNDLEASGLFISIGKAAFLQSAQNLLAHGPKMSEWRPLKARFLVFGEAQKNSSGLKISFRLYDVMTGKQLLGVALEGQPDNWRRMTHMMSDRIYSRITGEAGIFDSKIVFIENINKDKTNPQKRVMMMDWDGHNPQPLTNGKELVLTPRLSPDAKQIAFLAYHGKKARVDIMDMQTKVAKELGHFEGMTYAPRFSPDSSKVVMSFEKKGVSAIYVMDLKSKKLKQLTTHRSIDTSPCYSPDGKYIAFVSDRDGSKPNLFVMDADGENVRRISFGTGRFNLYMQPAWSPRGDLITFTKQKGNVFYIGVIRPDGKDERLIATGNLVESPTWSSNGRYIMYTQEFAGGKSQIMMIDLTGRNKRRIPTSKPASDGCWSTLLTDLVKAF